MRIGERMVLEWGDRKDDRGCGREDFRRADSESVRGVYEDASGRQRRRAWLGSDRRIEMMVGKTLQSGHDRKSALTQFQR
jgi:hypothetical protein